MKKFIIIVLTSLIVITVISPASASQPTNDLSQLKVNYESGLGHTGKTKDEMIGQFVKEGMSYDDAEYYAKLDILVATLENQGIKVNFDGIEDYSDEYVKANKKELRKKALDNLDKKALKAIISRNDATKRGNDDIQNIINFKRKIKVNQQDTFDQTIEVKYPDGSSVVFSSNTYGENEYEEVKPQTYLSGPWGSNEAYIDTNWIDDIDGGNFVSTTDWRFYSSGHYARVNDTSRWSYSGKSDLTLSWLSNEGSSSSAGIVLVDREYLSNKKSGYESSGAHVLQGYTDIIFKTTGSFSATYLGLGLTVNGGATWHQYAITEIVRVKETSKGRVFTDHWAASFI